MKTRGFTLIELLVVVAIIALLVALLVPTLTEANRIAKMVVCRTKLRQIVMGIHLYSNAEPRGFLPTFFGGSEHNIVQDDPSMPTYYYRISYYGGPADTYESWMDLVFPYVDNTLSLFACPAFQDPTRVDPAVFAIWKTNDPEDGDLPHPPSMHYGYNLLISGRGNPAFPEPAISGVYSLQMTQLSRSSEIILLLDYRTIYAYGAPWDGEYPSHAANDQGKSWDYLRAHGGEEINMAFADQHVEAVDRFDSDYYDYYHWWPFD